MPTHHDILEESYTHMHTACLTTTHQALINILFPALDGSHDTTTELVQRSGHCGGKFSSHITDCGRQTVSYVFSLKCHMKLQD